MKDLENLKSIALDVSEDEIKKIIRATYIKNYPPKIVIHGYSLLLERFPQWQNRRVPIGLAI